MALSARDKRRMKALRVVFLSLYCITLITLCNIYIYIYTDIHIHTYIYIHTHRKAKSEFVGGVSLSSFINPILQLFNIGSALRLL